MALGFHSVRAELDVRKHWYVSCTDTLASTGDLLSPSKYYRSFPHTAPCSHPNHTPVSAFGRQANVSAGSCHARNEIRPRFSSRSSNRIIQSSRRSSWPCEFVHLESASTVQLKILVKGVGRRTRYRCGCVGVDDAGLILSPDMRPDSSHDNPRVGVIRVEGQCRVIVPRRRPAFEVEFVFACRVCRDLTGVRSTLGDPRFATLQRLGADCLQRVETLTPLN